MRSEQELKRKPRPPPMERGKSGAEAGAHQDPCLLGSESRTAQEGLLGRGGLRTSVGSAGFKPSCATCGAGQTCDLR